MLPMGEADMKPSGRTIITTLFLRSTVILSGIFSSPIDSVGTHPVSSLHSMPFLTTQSAEPGILLAVCAAFAGPEAAVSWANEGHAQVSARTRTGTVTFMAVPF